MRETFYILRNNSKSEGTYLIDDEYKSLYPGEEITLKRLPVNRTANLSIAIYRRETEPGKIQNKKPKKVSE